MTKVSNPKLLMKQAKRTLVQLVIELRKKFDDQTEQLHRVNLKLQQVRVQFEDYKKQVASIKRTVSRKTKSLKQTVRRRRKVATHG